MRDEIITTLKLCYAAQSPDNVHLPIYLVEDKLSNYVTTKKDVKAAKNRFPPSRLRSIDEDIPHLEANLQNVLKNVKKSSSQEITKHLVSSMSD